MSMVGVVQPHAGAFDPARILMSRWAWCLAAVVFLATWQMAASFSELLTSLGDTDDATRLHQVKTLMTTGAWFDMSLPRIGGAQPLLSHWSRLVDAPLVALMWTAGLVAAPETAELAARIIWPVLVLFVFLRLLVRSAEAQGAPAAGSLMLVLALTCLTGLFQFRIGRIDHHNAMILGSIAGLLTLIEARRRPASGTLAGVLIGFSLSVGYEPIAFLLPAMGGMALLAMVDLAWLEGVRRMAVACAVTIASVFAVTVAPSLWLVAWCDALSLNMVVLMGTGAAALAAIDTYGRSASATQRVGALAVAGAIGLAAYGALEPRCYAGPFGQISPLIKPVWLAYVTEMFSAFTFFKTSPVAMSALFLLLLAGIGACVERWWRLRTPETLVLLCLMVLVAPTALWMIKLSPYASWVAAFALALSIADLQATQQITALTRQLVAVLLASQWTMAAIATPVMAWAVTSDSKLDANVVIPASKCMTTQAIRALAPLPKGRFAGAIDFGSYIVALTHHDALAAPYHRIDRSIIENQGILATDPADARRRLVAANVDYFVLCVPPTAAPTNAAQAPATGLEARLKAGETVDFLASVAINGTPPELRVWRVVR
jgi:hypothetical protein